MPARQQAPQPPDAPGDVARRQAEHRQGGNLPAGGFRIGVQLQRGFQRRRGELVDAHGAVHRVTPQLIDAGALAHHDAGLRSAQQFVAAERHHVDAAGDHLVDRRFVVQAVGLQINQRTAAQVLHDRQVVLAAPAPPGPAAAPRR